MSPSPAAFLRALALGLLLGVLASCGKSGRTADLVFIQSAEPETLDPALVSDQVSMRVSSALFEGLCRLDADGRPQPGAAQRWEISREGKRYDFFLRPGLQWSDGSALQAADFVQSWRRVLDPQSAADYASLLHVIAGARAFNEGQSKDPQSVALRALGPMHLQVDLEQPTPYFLDLCALVVTAPVPLRAMQQQGEHWMKPGRLVGNGSYLLEQWRLDDCIVLRRNPLYWDVASVALERIEVRQVQDANTALGFFLTGQCDLMMDKGMVPPALALKLRQQPWFHTGPYLGTWFIRANVRRPALRDVRVRQALALAVDKRLLVEKITQMGEPVADAMVPKGTGQGYLPPKGLGHDPKRARELLAQAGFPSGRGFPRLEYLYLPLPVERNLAIELQNMWQRELGIVVGLAKQEQKAWLQSMRTLDYDLCRSSWVGDYNDPSTFLDLFTSGNGQNRTGFASADYDRLIAQAAAEPLLPRRLQLQANAEQLLIEQAPVIPVYHYVGVQFFDAQRLEGVRINAVDDHPFRCMRWREPALSGARR